MLLVLLMFFSSNVFAMDSHASSIERRPSSIDVPNSPFYVSSASSATDDSVVDDILNAFHTSRSARFDSRVRPRIKDLVREHLAQSSDDIVGIPHEVGHAIVQRATQDTVEALEDSLGKRLTKKQASLLAGTATTIVTTIVALVVNYSGCK